MVQRISTASRYAQLVADMKLNQYNFNKLTAQLSSGTKLTSITDDPIASVNVLNTNRQLSRIETYQDNVGLATSELSALDDFMELARGYLQTAWDKAVQANNQTYNGASLEAIKTEIDELTKTMVDLANSEFDDNYIFAGANTKMIPYELDDNGYVIYKGTTMDNPDYIRQTEVADGVYEVINTTGDRVFGYFIQEDIYKDSEDVQVTLVPAHKEYTYDSDGSNYTGKPSALTERIVDESGNIYAYDTDEDKYYDEDGNEFTGDPDTDLKHIMVDTDGNQVNITEVPDKYYYEDGTECTDTVTATKEDKAEGVMGALRLLSNGLQKMIDGDTAGGYEEIHATLDMFADAHNNILNQQTKFGGIYNRMEMSSSTLETTGDNLTSYLTNLNSIDYAEAITQWMQAQYAYQASLQVAASSMNMSLLNYL